VNRCVSWTNYVVKYRRTILEDDDDDDDNDDEDNDNDDGDDDDDDDGVSWRWSIARRSTDVATPRRVVARGSCPLAPRGAPSRPHSLRNNPETDEPPPPGSIHRRRRLLSRVCFFLFYFLRYFEMASIRSRPTLKGETNFRQQHRGVATSLQSCIIHDNEFRAR
ncbi:hypothetical protein X777_07130, partial [Ooceraea biroi]